MEIIGQGERAALKILKEIYKDEAEYFTQFRFKDLMKGDFIDTLSERQEKETIDILVRLNTGKDIAIRIQDKHHIGRITECRDKVQRKMLEWNDVLVVDLWFNECIELWTDKVNDKSRDEIKTLLKSLDLLPVE